MLENHHLKSSTETETAAQWVAPQTTISSLRSGRETACTPRHLALPGKACWRSHIRISHSIYRTFNPDFLRSSSSET